MRTYITLFLVMLLWSPLTQADDNVFEIAQHHVQSGTLFLTNSGMYRLTENLTVTGVAATGIGVLANHVTIDLNGFTITGNGQASRGISQSSIYRGLTVRNGTIRGFSGDSSWGAGVSGYGTHAHYENLLLIGNRISLDINSRSQVLRCSVLESVGDTSIGFWIFDDTIVKDCVISGADAGDFTGVYGNDNCIVQNVQITDNTAGTNLFGVRLDRNSVVANCTVAKNTAMIYRAVWTESGSVVSEITTRNNNTLSTESSIYAVDGCVVSGCRSFDTAVNGGFWVKNHSLLVNNTAHSNGWYGAVVSGNSFALHNVLAGSGVDGMLIQSGGNRIEKNTAYHNRNGFRVSSMNNFMGDNLGHGNATNFTVSAAGNHYGRIRDISDMNFSSWNAWGNMEF